MRELEPHESMSPYLLEWAQKATAHGWYVDLAQARYAWPRCSMAADHADGARVLVWCKWSTKRSQTGGMYKSFRLRNHRVWVSPVSKSALRKSPWYSLPDVQLLHDFVVSPFVPEGLQPQGWPTMYGHACRCEKTGHRGHAEAARALAEAKAAREAGMERRNECRYYQCPDDALLFHLTSLERWSPDKESK